MGCGDPYWRKAQPEVPLVSRVGNSAAVGGKGFEDLVGGLGPDERLGILVPLVDPLADVGLELGDAAVR